MGETALDEVIIGIDFSGLPINGKRERTNSGNHSISPLNVIFEAFPRMEGIPSISAELDESRFGI